MSETKRTVFFAKLRPWREFAFSAEYQRIAVIDYESADQLLSQQISALKFFRDSVGKWVRLHEEKNGFLYAFDWGDIVIISPQWISERSPDVEM